MGQERSSVTYDSVDYQEGEPEEHRSRKRCQTSASMIIRSAFLAIPAVIMRPVYPARPCDTLITDGDGREG